MKMTINLILLATFLLGCNQVNDIDTYLKELHKEGKLNGNVLVIKNDTVLYENSFGYADGAKKHLLTPEHRFAIGSIYKEFPGVAIMQLKEEGLLTFEDKLSLFMPHLPEWANKITVRNLLQYSSGLPKIDWNSYFKKGLKVNEGKIIQDLSTLEELEFEPGTEYIYSNYNPFLLMRIVEILTEMRFKEYVEQKMLLPFEIDGIVVKEEYPYKDTSLMAIPFDDEFKVDDYEAEVTTICSSARGMYKWFSKLDNFKIITKESVKQLSEEVMKEEYIQSPLGRCDWEGGDIKLHFHHGNTENYEGLVRNYKQDGLMIILLTNQEHKNLYDIADNIYEYLEQESLNKNKAVSN
jgi:CubicO group peptidase (beta-lactamase class C family)